MAPAEEFPDLKISTLFDVRGKVVLITGGGTGLGAMMAKTLALHGCRVYIASRKQAVVDATAAGINKLDGVGKSGGKVVALQADLANKAACDKLASQVAELEGGSTKAKLHVLINCSGITWGSSLETYPEEQGWRKVLQVNVISTYYVTIACLPMLRRAADGSRDPARVINLGSSLGHMVQGTGYPMSGPGAVSIAYDASKAAIAHMTRGLALDLAPQHIAVNNLAPGVFPSRMSKHSIDTAEQILKEETMLGRLGNEPDMAGMTLWLCSRASAHIFGQTILQDGGWSIQGAALSRL